MHCEVLESISQMGHISENVKMVVTSLINWSFQHVKWKSKYNSTHFCNYSQHLDCFRAQLKDIVDYIAHIVN